MVSVSSRVQSVRTDGSLDGSLLGDLEGEDGVAARRLGVHVGAPHGPGEGPLLETGQRLRGREGVNIRPSVETQGLKLARKYVSTFRKRL